MADYQWPDPQHRTLIGKRITRVDSPVKVSGRAKYTYDQNPQGLLFGKVVRCPYAHAKVVSVDTAAAEKMPGVKAVKVIQGPGKEIFWQGDEIAAVAAVDESTAEDAARAIKVQYEQLPHFVDDQKEPPEGVGEGGTEGPLSQDDFIGLLTAGTPPPQVVEAINKRNLSFKPEAELIQALKQYNVDPTIISAVQAAPVKAEAAPSTYRKMADQTTGDPTKAFAEPDVVISEGLYGIPVIAHCCLESHGTVCHFTDKENLTAWVSTQGVSGVPGGFAENLNIPVANVRVLQDNVGGGFGSKLGRPDRWGIANAELARMTGKPVKIMLERAPELEVAGARPSVYARVKVAAKKDGTITAWESKTWGTGGIGSASQPPLPYVFANLPNQHKRLYGVNTNEGPVRAWRAPNHPQACLVTLGALDDLAAKLNMDPVDLLLKNLELVRPKVPGPKVYHDELLKASELMGWKQRWHPRSDKSPGPLKHGLGVSLHTWGGAGHSCQCDLTINPDGSVEIKEATQDLGTGTRTVMTVIAAETLGIPISQIKLLIGDTRYPPGGSSGGSTTVGGVSSSTRRAAVDALAQLLEKVAPALNAQPAELEAVDSVIRVKGQPTRSLPWKQACAKLGVTGITVRGKNPDPSKPPELTTGGVGGVQMADVSVDVETGIVKVNKMVAVQDCGLIIDVKTAESQVYGAMIMGVSYSLFEEKIMDPVTGTMLNPNMEFYRLAGYGDIPEMVVHMMTGPGYDERGVIGLGEPPVVSPGAAISNAVTNAIGVRVPFLPLTPDRVLAALERRQA